MIHSRWGTAEYSGWLSRARKVTDEGVVSVVYAYANVVARVEPVSVDSRLLPVNAVHCDVESQHPGIGGC